MVTDVSQTFVFARRIPLSAIRSQGVSQGQQFSRLMDPKRAGILGLCSHIRMMQEVDRPRANSRKLQGALPSLGGFSLPSNTAPDVMRISPQTVTGPRHCSEILLLG